MSEASIVGVAEPPMSATARMNFPRPEKRFRS